MPYRYNPLSAQFDYTSSGIDTPVSTANGGTGISSYTEGDIIYSDAANSLAKLAISTEPGESLITSGSQVRWSSAQDVIYMHDDFIGNQDASTPFGMFAWKRQAQSGGGIEAPTTLVAGHPGLIQIKGGTGTGWGGIGTDDILNFGGGETVLEFSLKALNVGDGTNDFSLYLGFGDRFFTASAEPDDGIYFHYNQASNSGNWIGKTASGGTRSSANSAIALDTDFHRYTIVVNAAGTSVSFYIDGTEIANSPLSSNIPSATGLQFGIAHVAGAERKAVLDYVLYKQILTTAR